MERFKEDEVYVATPCQKDVKKRFVIVLFRGKRNITACFLDHMISFEVTASNTFGKEFAQIVDPETGHKFNLDAQVGKLNDPADVANLINIIYNK